MEDFYFDVGYHTFSCHKENFGDNNQKYWYPWWDNYFIFEDKGYKTAQACQVAMEKQIKKDLIKMLKDI